MSDPEVEDVCDTFWDGNNGEELADKRACAGCHYLLGAMAFAGLMGAAEAIRRGDARRRALSDVYGYNGTPTPKCYGDDVETDDSGVEREK